MTPPERTGNSRNTTRNAAFSVRDLCVVVAMTAFVVAIQLPSIAHNESASSATTCRNNHRHLIQAWLMYADDNSGSLAPNNGNTLNGPNIAIGWLDFVPSNTDNTNSSYLVNPETYGNVTGLLGPYLQRNAAYFRCPSDRSTVTTSGHIYNRVRSISMNNWMGGMAWNGENQYWVYQKESEITNPGNRWVMTDERPDSINDFLMFVQMSDDIVVDYPGFFHSSGTWFSYADGHVDYRRWTYSQLTRPYTVGHLLSLASQRGGPDLAWLKQRTTELR